MSTGTHAYFHGCQQNVGMTLQGERRTASAPLAPWRARRVAVGIGLGLFGHGIALAPVGLTMAFARSSGGNTMETELRGILAFFVVEVILMAVVAISVVVRLVQRRSRDFAIGLLMGWLLPAAALGIVAGIADLRQ
jgi:hypothetical protein